MAATNTDVQVRIKSLSEPNENLNERLDAASHQIEKLLKQIASAEADRSSTVEQKVEVRSRNLNLRE